MKALKIALTVSDISKKVTGIQELYFNNSTNEYVFSQKEFDFMVRIPEKMLNNIRDMGDKEFKKIVETYKKFAIARGEKKHEAFKDSKKYN